MRERAGRRSGWAGMALGMALGLSALGSAPARSAGLEEIESLARSLEGAEEREAVEAVSRWGNGRLSYALDSEQWGARDRWATPREALESGRGDCEDYALLKYAALRRAGVPAERLSLLLGEARVGALFWAKWEARAVLAYWPEGEPEPLVLDNMAPEALPASQRGDLRMTALLGEEGMRFGSGEGRGWWEGAKGAPKSDWVLEREGGEPLGILYPSWAVWLGKARAEGSVETALTAEELRRERERVERALGAGWGESEREGAAGG